MTEEQESMVKAKLAEIADAIPECRGSVLAISTGNTGEEGDVTVFNRARGQTLVDLFNSIAARVAIAIVAETMPEKAVKLILRYGDDAPRVITYGFLTAVRSGLLGCIDPAEKEKLDKELEEVIGGGNQVS